MFYNFCDIFDDYGLYDLGYTGYDFTWWNQRKGWRYIGPLKKNWIDFVLMLNGFFFFPG